MYFKSLAISSLVACTILITEQSFAGTLTGTISLGGNSISSVQEGTFTKDGKDTKTPKDELEKETKNAKRYDGKTHFQSTYNIFWDKDDLLDTTRSIVRLRTINYTLDGVIEPSNFTTLPIKVTSIKFVDDNDKMMGIESFMFNSKDWYPSTAPGAGGITDNGLSGSINLITGESSYNASYIVKNNGAKVTYKITGKKKDTPPPPPSNTRGSGNPFAPRSIPEPSSHSSIVALGIIGTVLMLKRKPINSDK